MDRVTMKEKQPTSSYPIYVPNDIMVQILSRLPVKCLMRFECVCKLWQSIICDAGFCKLHKTSSETRLDSKHLVSFRYYHYTDRVFISFKNFNGSSEVPSPIELKIKEDRYILSSQPLDGLICLYNCRFHHALVLNLSTRQIVHLPPKPKNGFDDTVSCRYLLGFDPVSGDYKVLKYYIESKHWRRNICTRERSCEIFTLGTPSWRKICGPPGTLQSVASGACVNGTIYWLALEYSRSVIAFDVGKEVFRTIRFTPSRYSCLFAVGGQLVTTPVVNKGEYWYQNRIGFAFLEGCDKNEISVKEDIDFPANLEDTIALVVSGVSPTGEIVFTDESSSRNVYYHPRKKTWREDEWPQPLENDPSDPKPWKDQFFRYVCVENIVRLKDHDSVRNPDHSFLVE